MDPIYDNGSKELSLQSLTTTIIIKKILEDEGMLPNCKRDLKKIASRAIEVVNNMPLSLLLKYQLRPMILPIMDEMQSWYHNKDEASRVVLTQNGIVDLPKSIRGMLNDKNVSIMQRFKVACDHCLEQEIFDIGAQINFPHDFCRPEPYLSRPNLRTSDYLAYYDCFWSLAQTWYKIYKGNFHAKLCLKDISGHYCNLGFVLAFHYGNSAGVKYFVDRASISEIRRKNFFWSSYERVLTPNAYITIFKRLNEDERHWLKRCFSGLLFEALLKWPYQHQFLKAAEYLAKNMDQQSFWVVAAKIAKKARNGWEDHDYKGLFIDFWKLGRKSKIIYIQPGYPNKDLLCDVILMRDERLANLVLNNPADEFNFKTYLFNFSNESVCLELIFDKHFEALELFLKVCRVNNDKLIVKFQNDILKYLDCGVFIQGVGNSSYFPYSADLNKERKNILQEFISRMEKLKP